MLNISQHDAIFSHFGMAELGVQHHQLLPCAQKTYSISLAVIGNDRDPSDWHQRRQSIPAFSPQEGLEKAVPRSVLANLGNV